MVVSALAESRRGTFETAGQLVPLSSDLPTVTQLLVRDILNSGTFESALQAAGPKFPPATLTRACEGQIDPLPGAYQRLPLGVNSSQAR